MVLWIESFKVLLSLLVAMILQDSFYSPVELVQKVSVSGIACPDCGSSYFLNQLLGCFRDFSKVIFDYWPAFSCRAGFYLCIYQCQYGIFDFLATL